MDKVAKQAFIRRIAAQNQLDTEGSGILWSRHAITELATENWGRNQVERALLNCQVIEDYPTLHRPLPDCLILGWLSKGLPVHAVVAIDQGLDRILVVTVYDPSEEEWQHDWRTRK